MKIIVAVDENWGIGKNNGLLFKLKKDMAFFRTQTTGKIVVMGANTFDSFPDGALPNRVNIVLDNKRRIHDGAITVGSIDELFAELARYRTDDVFVIGGGSVYKLLLDYCDSALITKVRANGNADVFFPNLDERSEWTLAERSNETDDGNYKIVFCRYVRKIK